MGKLGTCLLALAAAVAVLDPTHLWRWRSTECAGIEAAVTVHYRDERDAAVACAGTGRAIGFLAPLGFDVSGPINIYVTDAAENASNGPAIAAWFDPRTEAVTVSSRAGLTRGRGEGRLFGLALDDDLYASIFAHEAAHAVVHNNAGGTAIPVAAHEYIAYTVQIATLPGPLRQRVLAGLAVEPYGSTAEVSETYLAMAPNRFAAKAYLHFLNAADGGALLHRLAHNPKLARVAAW